MDRANDVPRVALAIEHDRLPMAADVREELDPFGVAHESLRIVARRQHKVVAGFGHHQLVPT
jgi:hypothetical protein